MNPPYDFLNSRFKILPRVFLGSSFRISISFGHLYGASLPRHNFSNSCFSTWELSFNQSRIQTVIVAVISSNLRRAEAPGNIFLPARTTGLTRDSVVNVSQLFSIDRMFLTEHVGTLPDRMQAGVDAGLRLVLEL